MTAPFEGAGGEGIGKVVEVGSELMCWRRELVMRDVVVVRVCRVFGGAFDR